MGNYSVPRKKRKDPIITQSNLLFSKALKEKDYRKCGYVVLFAVYRLYAEKGIMNALERANSFIKRKKLRKGI